MGVPVISADVGGQKELIDDSVGVLIPCLQPESEGFDSRVFSSEEVDAYTDYIIRLLTDPQLWAEKAGNCRRKIEEAFTIEKMVAYFQQEFERLTTDETLKQQRMKVSQHCAFAIHLRQSFLRWKCRCRMLKRRSAETTEKALLTVSSGRRRHCP